MNKIKFQVRYTGFVVISLLLLLLFTGFYGAYLAQSHLSAKDFLEIQPYVFSSILQFLLMG